MIEKHFFINFFVVAAPSLFSIMLPTLIRGRGGVKKTNILFVKYFVSCAPAILL